MPVYDEITQAIIAELEKGVPPWVESRSSHLADECCLPKRVSGHQYPSSLEDIAGKIYLSLLADLPPG